MGHAATFDLPSDDVDWAKRAEYWGSQKAPKPRNHGGRNEVVPR
jgi:hypothetical protein